MTFKHIKFEDSSTMRSFERVAREKGWVKEESVIKEANVKEASLEAGDNFTENMVKLFSGLRKAGLETHADELEIKFLFYKKAQTIYETSKEKGEDLVDAAHPKGSHKLEDVDGDAVVETISDQHKKDLEVVNKKPTGKLSTGKEIISAVKVVLAEDPAYVQEIKTKVVPGLNILLGKLEKIKEGVYGWTNYTPDELASGSDDKVKGYIDNTIFWAKQHGNAIQDSFSRGSRFLRKKIVPDFMTMKPSQIIANYMQIFKEIPTRTPDRKEFAHKFPGWTKEVDMAFNEFAASTLTDLVSFLGTGKVQETKPNEPEKKEEFVGPPAVTPLDQLTGNARIFLEKINADIAFINTSDFTPKQKEFAVKWLNGVKAKIGALLSAVKDIENPGAKNEFAKAKWEQIKSIGDDIEDFRHKWGITK